MEDIKIDGKLIMTMASISILIGIVLWGIYNIYQYFTKNNDEDIAYFEGDSTSAIDNLGNKESDLIDENFFIQPNPEKKFQINNENYLVAPEEWGKEILWNGDTSAEFNFPLTVKDLLGKGIVLAAIDMSSWTEEGTYQDFIDDFTDEIRNKNILEDAQYTTRPITIGGEEFKIVMIEEDLIIGSYFCLAKDGYAYCLQAFIPKQLYTELWEKNINEIFSTFRIN